MGKAAAAAEPGATREVTATRSRARAWSVGTDASALVASAARLRWRAPELTLLLADRASASAAGTGEEAVRLRAEVLAVFACNQLGRGASAGGRAVRALRAAQAAGAQVTERLVRVELAACASDASAPGVALALLQPVLTSKRRVAPTARAAAMVAAADALAKLGGGPEVAGLLNAADRLYDASRAVEPDAVLLRRGVVHGRLAAHHRRVGDHSRAEDTARRGLALLGELSDNQLETGQVSGALTFELVLALLDQGREAEAVLAAQAVLRRSVRPAGAPAACWLRLALASRVHLPAGRHPLARRLLGDATFTAERHQLDAVLAQCRHHQAQLYERCAEFVEALDCLRAAQFAERRWRDCTGELRTLLAAEFGAAPPAAELRAGLAAVVADAPIAEHAPDRPTAARLTRLAAGDARQPTQGRQLAAERTTVMRRVPGRYTTPEHERAQTDTAHHGPVAETAGLTQLPPAAEPFDQAQRSPTTEPFGQPPRSSNAEPVRRAQPHPVMEPPQGEPQWASKTEPPERSPWRSAGPPRAADWTPSFEPAGSSPWASAGEQPDDAQWTSEGDKPESVEGPRRTQTIGSAEGQLQLPTIGSTGGQLQLPTIGSAEGQVQLPTIGSAERSQPRPAEASSGVESAGAPPSTPTEVDLPQQGSNPRRTQPTEPSTPAIGVERVPTPRVPTSRPERNADPANSATNRLASNESESDTEAVVPEQVKPVDAEPAAGQQPAPDKAARNGADPADPESERGSGRHRSDVALADLLAEALVAYQNGRQSQLAAAEAVPTTSLEPSAPRSDDGQPEPDQSPTEPIAVPRMPVEPATPPYPQPPSYPYADIPRPRLIDLPREQVWREPGTF